MQPTDFKHLRLESSPLERVGTKLYQPLFWMTLAALVAVAALLFLPGTRSLPGWRQGALLVLAVFVAGMGLARQLPAQNVVGASLVIALIAAGVHSMGSSTGVPFGPYVYTQDMGRPLFGVLGWTLPFIWVLFVLTSRGTARLILRPWRRGRFYGFALIGVTVVLVVLADIGLEVFATRVFHYWEWSETKLRLDLWGVPAVNFVAWALVALLILAFTTPLFINKKPGPPPKPDFHPALLWVVTNLVFASAAYRSGFISAAAVIAAYALIAGALAFMGGVLKVR